MGKLHLLSGLFTLVIFALSGQYMLHVLELPEGPLDVQRVIYRASHIYILLIGALNFLLGYYFKWETNGLMRAIQWLSSLVLIGSQAVFIYAFLTEPLAVDLGRRLTFVACVMVLAGVVAVPLAKGITFVLAKGRIR